MAALSAELELLKQQHTLQADELQATVDAAQKAKDEHVLSLEETQKQMEQLTGQLAENVDRCSKLEMDLQTTNHKLAQAAQCMSELQEKRKKLVNLHWNDKAALEASKVAAEEVKREFEASVQALTLEVTMLKEHEESRKAALDNSNNARDAAEQRVVDEHAVVSSLKLQTSEQTVELGSLRAELTALREEIEGDEAKAKAAHAAARQAEMEAQLLQNAERSKEAAEDLSRLEEQLLESKEEGAMQLKLVERESAKTINSLKEALEASRKVSEEHKTKLLEKQQLATKLQSHLDQSQLQLTALTDSLSKANTANREQVLTWLAFCLWALSRLLVRH